LSTKKLDYSWCESRENFEAAWFSSFAGAADVLKEGLSDI
jgi:hypothetical protein